MPPRPKRAGFIKISLNLRTVVPDGRAASSARCAVQVHSEILDLPIPDLKAFIAQPVISVPESGGRGVILLSDIYGHNDAQTQSVAVQAAAAGLPTVVPDLFNRNPWKGEWNKSNYESWRASLDLGWVNDAICASAKKLSDSCNVERIGLLGFCFGGGRVLEETTRSREGVTPHAAVAFYPTRFDGAYVGRNAKCPVMVVTGDSDELVPMEEVEKLHAGLDENTGIEDWEIQVYEGAGHAFAHKPKSEQDTIDSQISLSNAIQWLDRNI